MFGFGFHQTTKECKVIKVVHYRILSEFDRYFGVCIPSQSKVQVRTLGIPAWRSLGEIDYYLSKRPSQALVNWKIHWDTWPERCRPQTFLISFDLADEQFRVVPQPDSGGLDSCNITPLVLEDWLSAAVLGSYGQFEIWVMKVYDVKESWIMQFNIGIHVPRGLEQDVSQSFWDSKFYQYSSSRVLCLLKNGEILLEYKRRALVSYDPKHETFKDLLFLEMPHFIWSCCSWW